MSGGEDPLIGFLVGIIVLAYLVYVLMGKKAFGGMIAKITQFVVDIIAGIIKGIFKGIKEAIVGKSKKDKDKDDKPPPPDVHIHFHS
jgi:hypothetical protein